MKNLLVEFQDLLFDNATRNSNMKEEVLAFYELHKLNLSSKNDKEKFNKIIREDIPHNNECFLLF